MVYKIKKVIEWKSLILSLVLKELKKKYRHAAGGFGWMLFMPLVQAVVFTVIFKYLFKIKIENYPLFLLSGLFPWSFLKSSLDGASNSVLANANLIKKTYFPREILSIAGIISNLASFLLSLIILLFLSFKNNMPVLREILWLPLIIVIQIFLITGISLFFAGINAIYREAQFVLEIILFIWFYLTPIIYPLSMIKNMLPGKLFEIYILNPLTGIIYSYQQVFVYGAKPDFSLLISSALVSLCIFIFGWSVFSRCERVFIDMV